MMFSLFKRGNNAIDDVYNDIIQQSRHQDLYNIYGVPDRPQGRFQMIALHAAPYFADYAANGQSKIAQRLFDRIFNDIELSFREIGVGDLSVPKKMKRYMQDFNGIIQAHAAANADHIEITRRNVFGDDGKICDAFQSYITKVFRK